MIDLFDNFMDFFGRVALVTREPGELRHLPGSLQEQHTPRLVEWSFSTLLPRVLISLGFTDEAKAFDGVPARYAPGQAGTSMLPGSAALSNAERQALERASSELLELERAPDPLQHDERAQHLRVGLSILRRLIEARRQLWVDDVRRLEYGQHSSRLPEITREVLRAVGAFSVLQALLMAHQAPSEVKSVEDLKALMQAKAQDLAAEMLASIEASTLAKDEAGEGA